MHAREQLSADYALRREAGVTDVWFPPTAGRFTFKTGAAQTEGRLLQVRCVEPRGAAAPLHVHHDADETWYVLDGELTILVGDERFEAGPVDFVLGPRGVPHTFLVTSESAESSSRSRPRGPKDPRARAWKASSARSASPPCPANRSPSPSPPDPEDFARRAAQYGIEILGPPPTLD